MGLGRRAMSISAALSEKPIDKAKAASGWQPIETAPKDGTLKIMGLDANGHVSSMFFHDGHWCRWLLDNSMVYEKFDPTHWLPIPELPE
jgi:hypothetical protein